MSHITQAGRWFRRLIRLDIALILCCGMLFSAGYLQITTRWWFEDDPGQFYRLLPVHNPLAIFIDPSIMRGFGIGRALVPLQVLSQWTDAHLFGTNPLGAYIHNLLVLLAALVMLYILLRKITQSPATAFLGSILWMLLPTTIAPHFFINARHYIEGFFAFLLMVYLSITAQQSDKARLFIPAIIAGILAMLCKEIYAAVVPTFLFTWGIATRRHTLPIAAVVMAILYFCYRFWLLGLDVGYNGPIITPPEYPIFLYAIPYTLSVNPWGHLIYLGVFGISLFALIRLPKERPAIIIALCVILAALASIFPVGYAIVATYISPGTWYRAPFIVNALVILWGVYICSRVLPQRLCIAALVVALLIVLPGTEATRQLWDTRMKQAEREGRFYLANPDKLLYSEEDAWWFIIGIDQLYHVQEPHYVNKQFPTEPHTKAMLARYSTIWRYLDQRYTPDDALYQQLREQNP